MHSFHHSRGRIFFEVLCALTVSASCLAAWTDVGTPAFLPAAAAAALYGLVHLFDMRRPQAALAVAEPAFAKEAELDADLLAFAQAHVQPAAAEPVAVFEEPAAMTEPPLAVVDEPAAVPDLVAAPRAKKRRPSKKAKAAAVVQPVEEAPPVADSGPVRGDTPGNAEEEDYAPVTPLFEPEPFVRQQRAVFGRKAG